MTTIKKDWIQTLSGKKLVPLALTKEMVGDINEIAHALAGKVRFTGQTQHRYTVAQHCVIGSRLLPPAFAGAFLLHELSEVYLPDIASPVKPFVFVLVDSIEPMSDGVERVPWSELERQHARVILDALGLSSLEPLIYSPEVKAMDLAMLAAEKRDLLGPEPEPWGLEIEPACTGTINPWTPEAAEQEFLNRYLELFAKPL